jgi:hypothetical protein
MASHRFSTDDIVQPTDSNFGTTSGSDANSTLEKKVVDISEKTAPGVQETADGKVIDLPTYADVEAGEDKIHHPAEKDDILTHTIHVEDDPTLNALTFRTFFLGI